VKTLIATDGSPEATTALHTAIRMLNPVDRNVDVLCVAPEHPGRNRAGNVGRERYRKRILAEADQILKKAETSMAAGAGVVNAHAVIGSPTRLILERANDYDLVVVGAKGRGTVGEVGLGPVASRVAGHAPVPVLIARNLQGDEGLRILIAVDGSGASLAAIDALRKMFDLGSAQICLMHVAETPWLHLDLESEWQTYSEEDKEASDEGTLEKELVREGEAVLDEARTMLTGRHYSITTRMDQGSPSNEILSEADRGQYDLVVVGSTGARDLKHGMLGSVSFKLAWDAPCSVLVVPEPEQTA
jgi:nucleotide-binding universal stress UspA family protein